MVSVQQKIHDCCRKGEVGHTGRCPFGAKTRRISVQAPNFADRTDGLCIAELMKLSLSPHLSHTHDYTHLFAHTDAYTHFLLPSWTVEVKAVVHS